MNYLRKLGTMSQKIIAYGPLLYGGKQKSATLLVKDFRNMMMSHPCTHLFKDKSFMLINS